jgi:alcohol dehydrogenase (cytochrome c)
VKHTPVAKRARIFGTILLCAALVSAVGVLGAQAPVTFERLLKSDSEPQNWLTYSGSLSGNRYSLLKQITPDNVKNLELQWVNQVLSRGDRDKWEATPLVVEGVMYTVRPPNEVVALDAVTGRIFWVYTHTPADTSRVCCGRVNRGLAILGDLLYMGTIDGRLLALNAKTGALVWNVPVGRPEAGYSVTLAPLIVKDRVIAGPAGGEYGIRGFLAAYNARTGAEIWRFNTIPGPGEPGHETWPQGTDAWQHGGGSIWTTGAYDPALNLTYWGVGNPGPDWNGDKRAGDNLYTESVIALDPDTGKLKWHYQFTPHDEFDYDATQTPALADITWKGSPRKVLLWANRNGFWYVLDRATGEFLSAKTFTKVTWADGFDSKGRPNKVLEPSAAGAAVFPNNQGATNWYPPSYSPSTGLFYIPTWVDASSTYRKTPGAPPEYQEGQQFTGIFPTLSVPGLAAQPTNTRMPREGTGAVQAFDPKTGTRKWSYDMADVTDAGVLTTASNVLFSGGREGYFYALDARTGTLLWKNMLGGQIAMGPMTYAVNGRQYVAVAAGNAMFVFALRP